MFSASPPKPPSKPRRNAPHPTENRSSEGRWLDAIVRFVVRIRRLARRKEDLRVGTLSCCHSSRPSQTFWTRSGAAAKAQKPLNSRLDQANGIANCEPTSVSAEPTPYSTEHTNHMPNAACVSSDRDKRNADRKRDLQPQCASPWPQRRRIRLHDRSTCRHAAFFSFQEHAKEADAWPS